MSGEIQTREKAIPDSYEVKSGSVVSVEAGRIIVRVERTEDCGGCRSCAVRSLCRGRDERQMDLPIHFQGPPPAHAGDKVRIAYRAANAALAALVMFMPALLGLFFGGFAGHKLAGNTDQTFIIGSLAGFAIGIAVSYILAKTVPGLKPDVKLLST